MASSGEGYSSDEGRSSGSGSDPASSAASGAASAGAGAGAGAGLPARACCAGSGLPPPLHETARGVLECDRRFRTARPENVDDVFSLGALHALGPLPPYPFAEPTFVPPGWRCGAFEFPSPAAFRARFAAAHPEVAAALDSTRAALSALGVSAAAVGGAPAAALAGGFEPGDVDLALFGDALGCEEVRWAAVGVLVAGLRTQLCRRRRSGRQPGLRRGRARRVAVVETLTEGVLTLRLGPLVIQLILRATSSPSVLCHGFDLATCAVAFDGVDAVLTSAAVFAHRFRLTPVFPERRSTTFEARLKKYFGRGFGLVLPALEPGGWARAGPLALPWLTLVVQASSGRLAVGAVELPSGARPPASDYAPEGNSAPFSAQTLNERAVLRALDAGAPRASGLCLVGRFDYASASWLQARRPADAREFGLCFQEIPRLRLPDLLPLFGVRLAKRAAFAAHGGRVSLASLRALGLGAADVQAFVAAVCDDPRFVGGPAGGSRRGRRACRDACRDACRSTLQRFVDARLQAFAALEPELSWWHVADPCRQYTASFNPRLASDLEWYGVHAATAPPPPPSEVELLRCRLLLARDRSGGATPFAGPICPICQDDISVGAPNSVVLACGHLFHFEAAPPCLGVRAWLEESPCPVCKKPAGVRGGGGDAFSDSDGFSDGDGAGAGAGAAAPLAVAWP